MKYLLGFTMGYVIATCYMVGTKAELREALIDDINLRTDLINWIVQEGILLDAGEFRTTFAEKAEFINIVRTRENP